MNYMNMSTSALADAFGSIKAEMADLAKIEAEIKRALNARMTRSGETAVEGEAFRVAKVMATRSTVDVERIRTILNDVPVKVSTSVSFRVSARSAAAAAA